MTLGKLLSVDQILPEMQAKERWSAIVELANVLVKSGGVDPANQEAVLKALRTREETMSTGIGFGIAIPHASCEHVSKVVAAFGRSREGIEFDSLDDAPVRFVVMFVVPKDDVLIAEVKINTRDIDLVAKDMKAKVHLTAYKSRLMTKLKGRVISVSADNFKNEATGEIYFKGRIEIPESELKKLSSDIKLTAGMPVEAYIITGTRSLLSYLFTPIKESAYKAFREE